ncbi:MAG TPA: hypothetical protein VMR76_03100 [Candidatus Saccharimonadia bacterium]|nr:hypothetical protein [Candidatus Saccharimonadia bacterium]
MSLDFLEKNSEDFEKYQSSNFAVDLDEKPASLGDLESQEDTDPEPVENSEENTGGFVKKSLGNKKPKLSKKIIKKLKDNKSWAFASGGGGGIILIIIILVFIGAQELPGFASLMAAEVMVKANRSFERDTTEITSEDLALNSESPENQATIESTYSDAATGGMLSKLKGLTPNGAIDNLVGKGTINLIKGPVKTPVGKFLGVQELKGYIINTPEGSQNFLASDIAPSKWSYISHPVETFNTKLSTISDLSDAIGQADVSGSVLLRFGVLRQLIANLGGNPLSGIIASKFTNKTPEQSDIEVDMEAEQAINPTSDPVVVPDTEGLSNAVEDGENAQNADASNPVAVENIIQNGGNQPNIDAITTNDTSSLTSDSLLSDVSLLYAVGVPACIIYDSSTDSPNAGKTIDRQVRETERTYLLQQSTAAEQRAGNLPAQAAGALTRKYGNVALSNVEVSASGGKIDTHTKVISPEAGVGGQYTLNNVLLPQSVANFINPIASSLCHVVTNTDVAIGFLAGQALTYVVGLFDSFGLQDAAEAAAQASLELATKDAVKDGVNELVTNIVSDATESAASSAITKQATSKTIGSILKGESAKLYEYVLGGQIKKDAATGAVYVGATYGLALLAKDVVAQDMGTTYDGYSQNTDFTNQGHEGGIALANATEQNQYFGAPLSAQQVAYNNNQNLTSLNQLNSKRSVYQRYLALSNPFSLLSRLSDDAYADVSTFSFSSLVKKIADVFSPTRLFSDIFSAFNSKASAASSDAVDNNDYGIVQFGYTSQEDALTNPTTGDPSYQPLENAKILNSQPNINVNGQSMSASQYINQTYGACFTDSIGTLLTTMPSSGPDTSDPYILRDTNGNVIGGLCSDKYLGPNSADPYARDTAKNQKGTESYGNDLIFRWRLNQSYQQSLDLLTSVQNANS